VIDQAVEHFHAHLDACKRCREQPFNLCATGEKLLKEAALGSVEKIKEKS
jgi:hypothetical protein